ncbi:sensor histidine kinase [Paenibacillus puerhi]|uniref:sensor histidine kinase n=1 Tax=Paenibacillus puerhi TaxID=2692622 RepID=UPI00135C4D29|nr:sensor histidine kinase [Paenibacillus puerhi]
MKPIVALVRNMTQVKAGNLTAGIRPSGPLEIYTLGSSFNLMIRNIQQLLKEIQLKEEQKRLVEIRALQSQINPHFLLNTLNTIKLMATISKADNIQRMTESLTKLLAHSFNRGGMYSTVKEEMALLEAYVEIMRARYGDSFDFHYDVDPVLEKAYILKLLLQPILENAIIHGMQEKESRGSIRISGTALEGRACRFVIQDNGVGTTVQGMRPIDEGSDPVNESFSGIGLRNVHERIELNYGKKYGMTLTSTPGEGTTVVLLLPLLLEPVSQPNESSVKGAR